MDQSEKEKADLCFLLFKHRGGCVNYDHCAADLSQATCIAGLCGCEIESDVRSDESREPLSCGQPPDMLCAVRRPDRFTLISHIYSCIYIVILE